MYHRNAQPTVFSARLKGNGFLTPEYGGAVRIINFVHSFYKSRRKRISDCTWMVARRLDFYAQPNPPEICQGAGPGR